MDRYRYYDGRIALLGIFHTGLDDGMIGLGIGALVGDTLALDTLLLYLLYA